MANLAINDSSRLGLRLLERAKLHGHRVTFLQANGYRLYRQDEYCDRVMASLDEIIPLDDTTDRELVATTLAAAHDRRPFDAVLSLNEYTIEATAYAAERLGLGFTPHEAVRRARDKHRLREAMRAAGLASAQSRRAASLDAVGPLADEIGYPVVIKPTTSADSRLARIVRTRAALPATIEDMKAEQAALDADMRKRISTSFIVEEFLVGPLLSVEVGLRDGVFFDFMVSERIQAAHDETIELGSIMPASLGPEDRAACIDYAHRVVDALGFGIGLFHIEMILTGEGPKLVEANPRLMGGSMPFVYDFTTGDFIHDKLLAIHLGERVTVPEIPAGRQVASSRLQVFEAGTVAEDYREPPAQEISRHLVLYETYVKPGEAVKPEQIAGRFQLRVEDGTPVREAVEAVWTASERRLGVTLTR